jgi:hypothetical protein
MSGRRIRKEKNGLVTWITHTIEVGRDPDCSVFPGYAYFVTPQTPKLPNEPSVEWHSSGAGSTGRPGDASGLFTSF